LLDEAEAGDPVGLEVDRDRQVLVSGYPFEK
jgi:hypothetical protein